MKTFASLFTGFGLADVGAKQAGFTTIWGIEHDPQIHAWGNHMLGGHIECADVLQCSPLKYERPDLLHASPPCPNFSQAKQGAKETPHDLALAQKVADFITVLQPQSFTLENVFQYRYSDSFNIVTRKLDDLGYFWSASIINAADHGVPQTRKRLWLRAERDNLLTALPAPQVWQGWYAAIDDLLPSLPESRFAPWQLKRMPRFITSMLVDSAGYPDASGTTVPVMRTAEEPANTIISNHAMRPMRGFLIRGSNTSDKQAGLGVSVSTEHEPNRCATAQSSRSCGGFIVDCFNTHETKIKNLIAEEEPIFTITVSQTKRSLRALLEQGRVVAMTPRALARFQTLPDSYALPEKNSLACRGIGNGVPCALYKIIAEHSRATYA